MQGLFAVTTACLLLAFAVAGCADESSLRGIEATLTQADVPPDVNGQAGIRNLNGCGEHALLEITHGDIKNGSLNVQIKEGGGFTIDSTRVDADATGPISTELVGAPGTWTLIVKRTLEFDATFSVTLTC